MLFRRPQPRPSRAESLSAKPVRVVPGDLEISDDGGAKLKVPLRGGKFNALFRLPEGATKTFELDPLGLFVWNACDGNNSVKQVIRKLAKQYNLNEREAEVATLNFLQTLTKKGLVGLSSDPKSE